MASEASLEIHIRGPNAQALAIRLRAEWAAQFGTEHVALTATKTVQDGDVERIDLETAAQVAALISCVLAVPSAILATMELTQRMKLTQRLQPLLDDLRRTMDEVTADMTIEVHPPGKPPISPQEATPEIILDAAEKAQRNPPS